MKVKPARPPNFVQLDIDGDGPSVPIGSLSREEFEQFAKDTMTRLHERWKKGRAALSTTEK